MTYQSKLRRQGGAAVLTIPPALLKLMNVEVGVRLDLIVLDGQLIARPLARQPLKRYALAELLEGSDVLKALNAETTWALGGEPVGRETA